MKSKIRAKSKPSRKGGQNGNNGRNYVLRSFIHPDDPFMLLEEFALPPMVVESAIRRPPI